jgi:hypothetical protein
MGPTNIVAHELESYGVRTFSAKEMAFNILGLMHPLLFSITQVEPIWADLNGGMDKLPDLADITTRIRTDLMKKGELRRAIALDNSADFKIANGGEAERLLQTVNVTPRANFRFEFPNLEPHDSLADLSKLQGMVDLDKVMVITGFGEVGPWGSSRTRWEMEARGELTIQGCIEMAWLMGYIKHFDGRLKDGSLYVGWVDSKTSEPVDDKDVKGRYQKDILEHAGVRLIGAFYFVVPPSFTHFIVQSPNSSAATTLTRRSSTKRSSSFTTSSPSKSPSLKPRSSSSITATSATFGPAKATNGSSNSRRVPSSSFRRASTSTVPSLVRSRPAGTQVATVFRTTSSLKSIAERYGLSCPPPRRLTCPASPIRMSFTSTCTRRKSALALVAVWVER